MQSQRTKKTISSGKTERAGSLVLDVLHCFLTCEPVKMTDICLSLNKKTYTISKVINRLMAAEIIEQVATKEKDGRLKSFKLKLVGKNHTTD